MNTKVNSFDEYIGQDSAKAILKPALEATRFGKQLDHICFFGPAGTGKSTVASLIAGYLGTNCVTIDSRNLKEVKDFLNIVSKLSDGDVLFLDEIHGLDKNLEELLYLAIDHFRINTTDKDGNLIVMELPHFTLVGATTKLGEISKPLKSRFGLVIELESYSVEELTQIVIRKGVANDVYFTNDAAREVARRARGTARVAEKLISRVQDYTLIENEILVDDDMVKRVMKNLGIDRTGMTKPDRKYLEVMYKNFNNNPTSLPSLAAALNDSTDNIAETIEPFLIQNGFINRTPKGRVLTVSGLAAAQG